MSCLIGGSWTVGLDFPSPRQDATFSNHYAKWVSNRSPQLRCDLTAPGPAQMPRSLPTRFRCSVEGALLAFDLGALRITVDPRKSPWKATASLPALLDFLGRVPTRVEFPPTGRLLWSANQVVRTLGQAWTAFHDGFLLHASAVADSDGRVHCFSGLSNAGKSTAARQCRSMDHVAEDVVELRVDRRGRVWAHATPMNTVEKRGGHPFRGPLAGIHFVRKAKRVRVDAMTSSEIMSRLVKNAMMDGLIPTREESFLGVIARVSETIPCGILSFPKGADLDDVLEAPGSFGPLRRSRR